MTSNIQPFTHEQFGTIRTITDVSGEVWFVATDICAALDLSNTTVALQRLDEDERSKFNLGRQGYAWCVNEAGLYSLVLASRKPEAKSFKRWVTHEVLPSIRKHGGYLTNEKIEDILTDPDTIIELAIKLKSERAKRAALEKQAAIDTPKARFADAVSASHTSILIGDLAKLLRQNGYEIGQNRLFEMLRRDGYLCSAKGGMWNMLTQKAMDLNLFEVKETTIVHSDGHVSISKTTKVTGKGQVYFVTRFLDGRLPKGINDEEAA